MSETSPEVAVIGSPSSTADLVVDVLDAASERRLVGSLLFLETVQDGRAVRVTGQVTEVALRNRWHEQDLMRNIIKTEGHLPNLSGRQDVRTASFSVGAVFGRAGDGPWRSEILGTVPPTGTRLRKLDQATVDELVAAQREHLFLTGRAYGDDSVSLPMFIKHFGDPASGGYGEAHHSLVVGKTGSGKSTLAKMLLLGYARHPEMGVLVIDPKGEFADEIAGYQVGDSGLPFQAVLRGYGRPAARYGVVQVRLETWDLFKDVLVSMRFHRDLNIRTGENAEELVTALQEIAEAEGMTLDALRGEDRLRVLLERVADEGDGYLDRVYKGKEGQESLAREIRRILANPRHRAWRTWDFVTFLFERGEDDRPTIQRLVRALLDSPAGDRPVVALDLSVPGNRRDMEELRERFGLADDDEDRDPFPESLQKKVIYRIVADMRRLAETIVSERHRRGEKGGVNTLVVFEEAHRYAPPQVGGDDEDGRRLKAKLIEAVRETRKHGLGWFFIDQTIGGLDKQITQQVRLGFFGYGLSMGDELDRLREVVGGDQRDMNLYRSFKDPASYGAGERRFPWMAFGPVSPMASNRPLFFMAFDGRDFVERNALPTDGSAAPLRRPDLARAKAAKAPAQRLPRPAVAAGRPRPPKPTSLAALSDADLKFFE